MMDQAKAYLPPGSPGLVWRRSSRRRFDTAPRQHRELVVLLGLEGHMRYLLDGRVLEIGPRTLLWAFSDQAHVLLSESRDFDMWVLVIAPETLGNSPMAPPPVVASLKREFGPFRLDIDLFWELSTQAASIASAGEPSWREAGLRWWAMRAYQSCLKLNMAPGQRMHAAVQRAVSVIEADPLLDLGGVARLSGMSQSHLGQLFRRDIGMTLGDYRTERRLRIVNEQLGLGAGQGLLNAALNAGFGSYSQFFRAFTKKHGCNPREFYAMEDDRFTSPHRSAMG